MLHGPGKILFKASMKELAGPAKSSPELTALPKPENIGNSLEVMFHYEDLQPIVGAPYKVTFEDGSIRQGVLNDKGHAVEKNVPPGKYVVEFGEDPQKWIPPAECEPEHKKPAILAQARELIEQARLADKNGKGQRPNEGDSKP